MKAIDLAMPLAHDYGISAIAVSNSSHPGAMASYALRAARKGYIAFAFTHADALARLSWWEKSFILEQIRFVLLLPEMSLNRSVWTWHQR